jgi:hypothetical protein
LRYDTDTNLSNCVNYPIIGEDQIDTMSWRAWNHWYTQLSGLRTYPWAKGIYATYVVYTNTTTHLVYHNKIKNLIIILYQWTILVNPGQKCNYTFKKLTCIYFRNHYSTRVSLVVSTDTHVLYTIQSWLHGYKILCTYCTHYSYFLYLVLLWCNFLYYYYTTFAWLVLCAYFTYKALCLPSL